MVVASDTVQWEEDPLVFNFHNELPGKVKMHTRKLDLKDWIKIDKTYPDQIKLRKEILKTQKDQVFVSNTDEAAEACKWELWEMIVEYLPKRFPDIFEIRDNGIYNKVLQETVPISKEDSTEDPLFRANRVTQEDWCLLEWDETQQAYVLTSSILCFPMRWSLLAKFNRPLGLIHSPVKPFEPHLQRMVYGLLKSMPPEAPVWRANWAVFNDLKGPLDLYTPTGSEDRNDVNNYSKYKGDETGRELTFRAEYQTLRKLPKTKCVVFGIRTYQRYLNDFENHPASDAQGLITAIETLMPEMAEYKGAVFWKEAAVKYLRYIIRKKEGGGLLGPWSLLAAGSAAVALVVAGVVAAKFRYKM